MMPAVTHAMFARRGRCGGRAMVSAISQLAQRLVGVVGRAESDHGVGHDRTVVGHDDRIQVEFEDAAVVRCQLGGLDDRVDDRRRIDGRPPSGPRGSGSRPASCVATAGRHGSQPARPVGDHVGLCSAQPDADDDAEPFVVFAVDAQIDPGRRHRLHDQVVGVVADRLDHGRHDRIDVGRRLDVERDARSARNGPARRRVALIATGYPMSSAAVAASGGVASRAGANAMP